MKQTISLAIILFALPVLADVQWKDGPYTYTVADSQATIIAFDTNYSGDISIPAGLPQLEWGGYPVIAIGPSAFRNCLALTSVTIPASVTTIGDYAFYNCTSLTSISIPGSVITIDRQAFGYCTSLTSVMIPDSVATIGFAAFHDCTSLTSVTIGNSVATIGAILFWNCTSLTSIDVGPANPTYSSLDGVLFNKAQTTLIQYPPAKPDTSYTIPDSVTTIDPEAFQQSTVLTSVTIPDSVTSIGAAAFYDCTALTSVMIPDSVTTIGSWAFQFCTALTSVTIPGSVTNIGNDAFGYCTSLTSVMIPDSVTTIGSHAFFSCTSLTSIGVDPANPTYSSLDGVLFNKAQTTLIQYPAGKPDTSYNIPGSVATIGSFEFFSCSSLTSVVIPDSLSSIGRSAFQNCTSLTSVYFCGAPPTPGSNLFQDTPATIYYLPQHAAQWPATYANRPTALWLPAITQSGMAAGSGDFTLSTFWAPAQSITIEAATRLVNPDWTTLHTTNIPPSGLLDFTDSASTNFPARFYRIAAPRGSGGQPFRINIAFGD